ncbi:MAG: hypothetical protein QXD43_06015, partial [Candidatus Aenigmatarchaeota archaeon]
ANKNYESCIKKIESEKGSSLDEIINLLRETLDNLRDLKISLMNADKELNDLCKRKIDELKQYNYNINKFLSIVKEINSNIVPMKKSFDTIIDEVIESLEKISRGESIKITWEQAKDQLNYLRKKLLEIMKEKNILSEEEIETLFLIIEVSARSKVLESTQLYQIIMENLKKSPEKAETIVESLVSKNLLKKNYSLPI